MNLSDIIIQRYKNYNHTPISDFYFIKIKNYITIAELVGYLKTHGIKTKLLIHTKQIDNFFMILYQNKSLLKLNFYFDGIIKTIPINDVDYDYNLNYIMSLLKNNINYASNPEKFIHD